MADREQNPKRGFNLEGLVVSALACLIPVVVTFLFLRPELERRALKITGLPALDAFMLGAALDGVLFAALLWLTRSREQDTDWLRIIYWVVLSIGVAVLALWLALFMTALFGRQA